MILETLIDAISKEFGIPCNYNIISLSIVLPKNGIDPNSLFPNFDGGLGETNFLVGMNNVKMCDSELALNTLIDHEIPFIFDILDNNQWILDDNNKTLIVCGNNGSIDLNFINIAFLSYDLRINNFILKYTPKYEENLKRMGIMYII